MMTISPVVHARSALRLALLLPLLFVASTYAQQSSDEVSPEVVQLYSAAKRAQAQGDIAAAIQDYQGILKQDPHLAAAYNNLGLLYYSQHDFSRAIPVLQAGLKVNPHMSTAAALLGSCWFASGQYPAAREALESALRANPNDSQVAMLLARTLIQLGDEPEAVTQLRAIIAKQKDDQQAWYLLGQVYMEMSQQALAQVRRINPDSALTHMISGEIMESMNNYPEALVELKKAAEMDPQQPGVEEHLGNVYWDLGQWDAARKAFQAELSSNPANCSAEWKAADCLVEQHSSPEQALDELNHAIRHCSGLMQARVDRARTLIQLGRPKEALADLLPAEKDSPEEPSIHYLLAQVYRAQGDRQQFEAEMNQYAELQQSASHQVSQRAAEVESLKTDHP